MEKVKSLEELMRQQAAEIKVLGDNYNSERVLRKKYYNMVEDMKGKIRVYCRARPLSKSEIARVSSALTNKILKRREGRCACIKNTQSEHNACI